MNRISYIILTIVLLMTEIIIGKYVHDSFVRPYVGDVLVVILIYCMVRCIFPKKLPWLPLYVFIFAACIEIMQGLHFIDAIGLGHNRLARIIFGSTFDWHDLVCYAVGCIIVAAVHWLIGKYRKVA